jgi:hypothetical protein
MYKLIKPRGDSGTIRIVAIFDERTEGAIPDVSVE